MITVLSGMSTLEQMEDNLSYMEHFQPLTDQERAVVAEAQQALEAIPRIPCTACQYCVKGCPKGVAIPGIFKAMNNYLVYNNLAGAQGNYGFETRNGGTASPVRRLRPVRAGMPPAYSHYRRAQACGSRAGKITPLL